MFNRAIEILKAGGDEYSVLRVLHDQLLEIAERQGIDLITTTCVVCDSARQIIRASEQVEAMAG